MEGLKPFKILQMQVPMWDELRKKYKLKRERTVFYAGVTLITVSAVLLVANAMGDSTYPALLGVLGIIAIASSNFRAL